MLGLKEATLVAGLLMQTGSELPADHVACVARNIYHEARGESIEGQLAVANVTMNRVASPDFPDDPCEVVYHDKGPKPWDCQFSWTCDGKSDTPSESTPYQLAVLLAIEVMEGRAPDNTDGVLYYVGHSALQQRWVQNMEKAGKIGNHYFLREKVNQG